MHSAQSIKLVLLAIAMHQRFTLVKVSLPRPIEI
jgi:hypothetical protein